MSCAISSVNAAPAPVPDSFDRPRSLPLSLRVLRSLPLPRKLGLCDRFYGRAISTFGTAWVATAAGPVWQLDLANPTHRWLVYGDYEGPGFWRWFRRQSTPTAIVDSGANIGQTVLQFAAAAPHARILAYEPGAAARAWLSAGVAANRFAKVTVEPFALGAAAGAARLSGHPDASLHGSWHQVNATDGEPVAVVTLDEELDRHRLAVIDVWKLDLEGHELPALQGAGRSLRAGRIRAVHIEISGEAGSASAREFLAACGYRGYTVSAFGRPRAVTDVRPFENILFLAPGHPDFAA